MIIFSTVANIEINRLLACSTRGGGRKHSWLLLSLTFFLLLLLHALLFTHFEDTQEVDFYWPSYFNIKKKFCFTKADFRAFFLLFTASVRSRKSGPTLVPGVFFQSNCTNILTQVLFDWIFTKTLTFDFVII